MKTIFRLTLIVLFLTAAIGLLQVNSERQFMNYEPQEGEASAVVLSADSTYTQTFTVARRSVSRIAIYLRPTSDSPLPNLPLLFTVSSPTEGLTTVNVPASFINRDGTTQIRFNPPLTTSFNDLLTLTITVPPDLSGRLRAQTINQDDNGPAPTVSFAINSQEYPSPLAFQVYYNYRPPLSYQLSLVFIFLALWLMSRRPFFHSLVSTSYVLIGSVAYVSPAVQLNHIPWLLGAACAISLTGMLLLLRSHQLTPAAVFLGAHAYAFSTYFALHAQVGRSVLLVFSLLPFIFYFIRRQRKSPSRVFFLGGLLSLGVVVIALALFQPAAPFPAHTASLKDILLNPNQVPDADKLQAPYFALQIPHDNSSEIARSGGWDNYGSYLGFINVCLAIIGLLFYAKRHIAITLVGLTGLIVATVPLVTTSLLTWLWFPPQYIIILLTFALSFFAALGLFRLQKFLGPYPVTSFIVYSIMFFALFDLFNVIGKTLQFSLL
jgi:hypothetical protein